MKTLLKFHLTLVRMAIICKQVTRDASKDVGEREHLLTPGGNVTDIVTEGISRQISQKIITSYHVINLYHTR